MADPLIVDRNLLRMAGEHLGTLAERAKEAHDMATGPRSSHSRRRLYNEYARLWALSRDVLEVARG